MNYTWSTNAACRDLVDIFFANIERHPENADRAKEICASCPCLKPCREFAITNGEIHGGIWAGMTSREIRREMIARGISCD